MDNINTILYTGLKNYFNVLFEYGEISLSDTNKLLVLKHIRDLSASGIIFSEEQRKLLHSVIKCLTGTSCLLEVPKSITHNGIKPTTVSSQACREKDIIKILQEEYNSLSKEVDELKPFVINGYLTGNLTLTTDKTYNEALEVLTNGREVRLQWLTEEGGDILQTCNLQKLFINDLLVANILYENSLTMITWQPSEQTTMHTITYDFQTQLTFDDTPTSGSNNPVKSNGIYTALQKAGKKYVPSGILHHGLMSLTAQPEEVYTSRLTLPFYTNLDYSFIENREVICLIVPAKLGRSVQLSDYITNYEEVVEIIEFEQPVDWLLDENDEVICYVEGHTPNTWQYHEEYDSDGSRLRLLVLNFDPSVVPAIKFTKNRKIVPVYDIEEKPLTTPRFTKETAQQLFNLTNFKWKSSKKGMFSITVSQEEVTGNIKCSNFVIELLRRRVYYARRNGGRFNRWEYNTLALFRKVFVSLKGQLLFKGREGLDIYNSNLQRYTVIIRAARCNKHKKRIGAWMYYKLHFTMESYDSRIAQYVGLQPFKWHDHIRP